MTKRYRSGFENTFAQFLGMNHIPFEYESVRLKYTPKIRTYVPDFHLYEHSMYIETKGRFVASDRAKHKLIQEQFPDLDIRFLFQDAKLKLYAGSDTTYGDWCKKNGFKYAEKETPKEWLDQQI